MRIPSLCYPLELFRDVSQPVRRFRLCRGVLRCARVARAAGALVLWLT
jgi:hypothetical protein